MPLKLMYITNRTDIALVAEKSGVDRIFVDLEILGKEERQGHLNTVISHHNVMDISKIRNVLTKSELLVRIDPMHEDSKKQINEVIDRGADIVMLPMFTRAAEVERFIEYVNGRAKTMLLLETPQALARIDDILSIAGVDELHVGLNDLHLGMKLDFMFELLFDGICKYISEKMRAAGIPFGFGGIARIGYGILPAERIICQHYHLGSSMAILSRSFCDAYKVEAPEVEEMFEVGVKKIRNYEISLKNNTTEQFETNERETRMIIQKIISEKQRCKG